MQTVESCNQRQYSLPENKKVIKIIVSLKNRKYLQVKKAQREKRGTNSLNQSCLRLGILYDTKISPLTCLTYFCMLSKNATLKKQTIASLCR